MNKIKLLIVTLFYLTLSAKAQEKYLLKIDKENSDLRIQIPVRNYFYISKIIDGRQNDTSRIGLIYKRVANGNEKKDIIFQDGLVSTFRDLIQMSKLDEKLKSTQQPFCLKVMELEMSGVEGNLRHDGRIGLGVTFLKQANNGIKPIFSTEIFVEAGKGSVQANMVKLRICIEKTLSQFENHLNSNPQSRTEPNTKLDTTVVSNLDVAEDIEFDKEAKKFGLSIGFYSPSNSEEIPLNVPRKYGIYNSFDSFKKNQPDIVGNFLIEPEVDVLKIYSSTHKQLKGEYFCLSDGKNFYMNTYRYNQYRSFVKVYIVGDMILWNNTSSLSTSRQNSYVTTGAIVGGAIGGLLATAMTSESVGCKTLNFKTETYSTVDKPYLLALLKNDSELLKLYKTAPNQKDGEVLLYYVKEYYKKH
jgi:hypothetical protein